MKKKILLKYTATVEIFSEKSMKSEVKTKVKTIKAEDYNQALHKAFWHYRRYPWQIISIKIEIDLPF